MHLSPRVPLLAWLDWDFGIQVRYGWVACTCRSAMAACRLRATCIQVRCVGGSPAHVAQPWQLAPVGLANGLEVPQSSLAPLLTALPTHLGVDMPEDLKAQREMGRPTKGFVQGHDILVGCRQLTAAARQTSPGGLVMVCCPLMHASELSSYCWHMLTQPTVGAGQWPGHG